MIHEVAQMLVDAILGWGYVGIFILMSIESSFIPFPSEIVLIPAGYLVFGGEMNSVFVLLFSLCGSLFGALINYYLALYVGRNFLQKYGKYFFISESALVKMDHYFENHGEISTFTGRLIPGVRQLISIPAGLAKMNMKHFLTFTAIGSLLWSSILVVLGYFLGDNQELIHKYLQEITVAMLLFVVLLVAYYIYRQKAKNQ